MQKLTPLLNTKKKDRVQEQVTILIFDNTGKSRKKRRASRLYRGKGRRKKLLFLGLSPKPMSPLNPQKVYLGLFGLGLWTLDPGLRKS